LYFVKEGKKEKRHGNEEEEHMHEYMGNKPKERYHFSLMSKGKSEKHWCGEMVI
jgi:hypothetical protein